MKILLLADQAEPSLWEHLDRRKLEGVELVLSCGDLPAEYLSFLTCFTAAPILYVHGNHDGRYAKKPPEGCICIEDTVYTHNGLRILGLGGSMRYRQGPHMYTEHEMKRRVDRLRFKLWKSKGFDILLTHAPAYQLGDDTDLAHTGFQVFLDLIDKYQPRFLVHGHVHQSYQHDFKRIRQRGETQAINAFGYYILEI
ncbi:MAG: metallophosphoesterase family protein [Clostridiales bacterium]|nr:metallophosphoesterase family protein [Clostridiales bacterium]MDY3763123.1 metallophosphoesterase family protein [Candidatus Ventricola sp.]MCI7703659.1 metallophosphoesterase family protein [Clostridiales bacterium]MDY3832911.1 metallophosphoesterase family protein [Candidatus Ventricola sp.]MDY4541665.1 metallophosphoesterase family protein [Candidatus Ventricola sp.]